MSHSQDIRDPIDEYEVNHEFECDEPSCTTRIEGQGVFSDVWSELKTQGWRARKDDAGNWCHYCPEHAQR